MEDLPIKRLIPFTPRWRGPIEGHAVNTVRSFFPKLCADHEFDDLMQEGYIVFMRCSTRYKNTANMNPAWFMSLFRNSLRNKLINLSAKCKHTVDIDALNHDTTAELCIKDNIGYLACVFSDLDVRVRRLTHDMCFGDESGSKAAMRTLRRQYVV